MYILLYENVINKEGREKEKEGKWEGLRAGGKELDRFCGCKCQILSTPLAVIQALGMCLLFGWLDMS